MRGLNRKRLAAFRQTARNGRGDNGGIFRRRFRKVRLNGIRRRATLREMAQLRNFGAVVLQREIYRLQLTALRFDLPLNRPECVFRQAPFVAFRLRDSHFLPSLQFRNLSKKVVPFPVEFFRLRVDRFPLRHVFLAQRNQLLHP